MDNISIRSANGFIHGTQDNVPLSREQADPIALNLQELMAVSESEMRVALLKKAFISDWEGAAPGGAAAADPK